MRSPEEVEKILGRDINDKLHDLLTEVQEIAFTKIELECIVAVFLNNIPHLRASHVQYVLTSLKDDMSYTEKELEQYEKRSEPP